MWEFIFIQSLCNELISTLYRNNKYKCLTITCLYNITKQSDVNALEFLAKLIHQSMNLQRTDGKLLLLENKSLKNKKSKSLNCPSVRMPKMSAIPQLEFSDWRNWKDFFRLAS